VPTVVPGLFLGSPSIDWARPVASAYRVREVLDVGANTGEMVQLWLAAGAQHVHAVEPIPSIYEGLAARYAGDPRVTCYPIAAGEAPGRLVDVNVFNCWTLLPHADDRLERSAPFRGAPPFSVDVTTIDDLISGHGCRPDLIKIDVDGREPEVLRGARRYLAARRPVIILELSYLPDTLGDCCECMVRELYRTGYVLTELVTGRRLPTVRDVMQTYPWNTSYDVVCEPAEGPPTS
jgi:FkbM family methyltransferase